jgi:hypothetical protein
MGRPLDPNNLTPIFNDKRLLLEKPWVSHRALDLVLGMITFQPSLLTQETQLKFIQFWKGFPNHDDRPRLLCPRNLLLLAQAPNSSASWKQLGSLVKNLIRERLMSLKELQEDCMILLRQDWPADVKQDVSGFLKDVLSSVSDSSQAQGQEMQVMDWIAWYCSANDGDGDEF